MTRPAVDIEVAGRSGSVTYREGAHAHRFDWEFGGGDVVVTIYVPSADEWDAKLPWAAGRRNEVLNTVAREVRWQKCGGSVVEISERWIHLREPPPLPARFARALRRFLASFRENG